MVTASDLLPGDVITEIDTPDGPWMRVVEVVRDRRVLLVAVEDLDEPVEVPVGRWTDSVLRRSPACPKCSGGPFVVSLDVTGWEAEDDQGTVVLTLTAGSVLTDTWPAPEGYDSDGFIDARCLSCGLSLVNEPGELRLRRAAARQATAGERADATSPVADLTHAEEDALFSLVQHVIAARPAGRLPG